MVTTMENMTSDTLTGSRVNPFTPFPVVMTTMVALPYKAYPEATKFEPGCRTSAFVTGPSDN